MPTPSNSPVISSAGQLGNNVVTTAKIADNAVTVAKINPGSNGQVLGVVGGVTAWTGGGMPVGAIMPYAGTSAPTGYLICDGSTVSQSTYADLFALIAHTYGADPGGGNFILPNLKGKVVAGYNASETEFNAVGKTGGAKTHTLTIAEMPAHTHPIHKQSGFTGEGNIYAGSTASGATATDSTGGDGAHNNLQPYISLNYIIKT